MNPKDEALKSIEHVAKMLHAETLGALERKLAIATLEHAAECVVAIQEVKRLRRAKAAAE